MRIAVTGSSGLIGTAFTDAVRTDGDEVIRLVRRPPRAADEITWDPAAPRGGIDLAALAGTGAVLNLAGAPLAAGRWTQARKAELRASRIQATEGLTAALTAMDQPPATLLSGSAIGWYADTGGREVDESAPAGTGFLAGLVRDWEAAAEPARAAGIRVANLRTGIVLARQGGMLGRLAPLFRLGLGARIGPGTQFISWITLTDQVRALRYLLGNPAVEGPVNLTAPDPVTNADFTAALAKALGRPALLRAPAPVIRAALGELSGDLLASARVIPRRLLAAGFTFRYADIASALAAELRPRTQRDSRPAT
ncbi:MAG: TIGR01777 family oxidoreductase [Streptosporangiaceae bacterium]|jgi:uncharacterized protein (TIGR01777 family)